MNRQAHAHIHFLSRSKQLDLRKVKAFIAFKLGRKKPSLIVNIGRRRNVNALDEYRRIFASRIDRQHQASHFMPGDQGSLSRPAQTDPDRAARADRGCIYHDKGKAEKSDRRHLERACTSGSRSGTSYDFYGAIPALLLLALLRGSHAVARSKPSRYSLIAVMLACAGLGGAYFYRTMKAGGDRPLPAIDVEQASSEGRSRSPNGKKLTHDRLTPDAPLTETAPPVAPAGRAALAQPPIAGSNERGDGPLLRGKLSGDAPASSLPASGRQDIEQPTVVRSETYLPDGTRADTAQPAAIPSVVRLNSGQARPPLLAAAKPANAPAEAAPQPISVQPVVAPAPEAKSGAATEAPAQAAPAPASSSDSDYFVQVKSDQDQKAAEEELTAVVEKYKPVLGQVRLITRSVDLKSKGVWFRVLAGPLKSRGEASGLCEKLKNAGLPACLVHKSE